MVRRVRLLTVGKLERVGRREVSDRERSVVVITATSAAIVIRTYGD